jgi:ABC-type sugar transport systems, permease components
MSQRGNPNIGLIWLFLAPALLLFIAFFLYPFCFTLFTSMMKWKGGGGMSPNGLANYAKLLGDGSFILALRNNVIWALASGFVQVPLAVVAAMILARRPRGWKALRTIYFLPNVISTVALAMVWVTLYNPQYGAFKALLGLFGLPSRHWLGDPSTALAAVILQTVVYIGYYMIIALAAVFSIPRELYEAAQIDGASTLRQEFRITLPMLRGTIVTCATLAMAYGMRHFESTFLMTGGGPAYATNTMGIALYLKMDALRYGEASAAGMILILMGTVLVILLRRLLGRTDPLAEAAQ